MSLTGIEWKKNKYKKLWDLWFHLYKVHEETELVWSDRSQHVGGNKAITDWEIAQKNSVEYITVYKI